MKPSHLALCAITQTPVLDRAGALVPSTSRFGFLSQEKKAEEREAAELRQNRRNRNESSREKWREQRRREEDSELCRRGISTSHVHTPLLAFPLDSGLYV